MTLPKLFILAFWCTLLVWYVVERCTQEHIVAPTIIVTPQGE